MASANDCGLFSTFTVIHLPFQRWYSSSTMLLFGRSLRYKLTASWMSSTEELGLILNGSKCCINEAFLVCSSNLPAIYNVIFVTARIIWLVIATKIKQRVKATSQTATKATKGANKMMHTGYRSSKQKGSRSKG